MCKITPRNDPEKDLLNAIPTDYAAGKWMQEILASFSAMVEHIADMRRLQQECNIVSIRIAKAGISKPRIPPDCLGLGFRGTVISKPM